MEEKIVQFIEDRYDLLFGIMLVIQIVGAVLIVLLGVFIGAAGGGLDIMEFDPPGLNEAYKMLPFVFPLTLVTSVIYPKVKRWKWARWLLIFTVIVNVILAVPLAMVLVIVLLMFLR